MHGIAYSAIGCEERKKCRLLLLLLCAVCGRAAVLCLVVCEIMMMMLIEDGHRKMAGFAQQCESAAHKKKESVLSLTGRSLVWELKK
jgi:hypothetical protein